MAARPRKEVDTSSYAGRFAERLKTLREKAGFSVRELAELAGFSRATVQFWEAGDFSPNVEQLEILAGVLEVEPRLLLPQQKTTVSRKKR